MNVNDYQKKASETAIFPEEQALNYLTLGLVGEAGEVANKVKKLIRDGNLESQKLMDEIGDVMWYSAMLCNYFKVDMSYVLEMNLYKLNNRKKAGTLSGSGDQR